MVTTGSRSGVRHFNGYGVDQHVTDLHPADDGLPVRNIYPYDAHGRLLHDVRLYDQNGRPLDIGRGATDPNRRPVFNRNGARLFNAFPVRYFDPGTNRVAHPDAVPHGLKPKPLRRR